MVPSDRAGGVEDGRYATILLVWQGRGHHAALRDDLARPAAALLMRSGRGSFWRGGALVSSVGSRSGLGVGEDCSSLVGF